MRAGVKYVATAIAVCLTFGVLMIGIFAATSANMEITSLIGWQSIGVEMNLNGKVSGNKSSDIISSSFSDTLINADKNKTSTWSIGTLNFEIKEDLVKLERYCEPIVIRFGVTNTSEEVNIYYFFDKAPEQIVNIGFEYQLAHGILGTGETWETDFFSNSYSGNMEVDSVSTSSYAIHQDNEYKYIAPGETAVFEIRMVVDSFSQSINRAQLTPILKFQNTPREAGTIDNPYKIVTE